MATRALITAEQYLAMHFEREPELVHGELAEKPLPNKSHGRIQQCLAVLLDGAGYCCTEVRMRLAEDLYRIPDVALFQNGDPGEEIPSSPPLVVVEITSPDDRLHDILQKLAEYEQWGVRYIWLIEPELKKCHVYRDGSLTPVSQFELPIIPFSLETSKLFA
jgi:Uma2 family endonuclease